ncbi:MAG: class I SAM-dependent rRNA methyltransferase [Spirochaetes bacterium]|nr:class I SAM-dependent rRNA methyltransferase [Spirochaetota bacterium]
MERTVLRGHPWIFSGSIKQIQHYKMAGEICTVLSEDGKFVARGYVNASQTIAVRVMTLRDVKIDGYFIRGIIEKAYSIRASSLKPVSNAFRIVNAEGDFFPGLVVDKYDRGLVIQISTAGIRVLKELIINELVSLFNPEFIYEKYSGFYLLEGIEETDSLAYGKIPKQLVIHEGGVRFHVDVASGQKTGFYLDQRRNRILLSTISGRKDVLNCFCYTGGFGVHAAAGGAKKVVNIDTSEWALDEARKNALLNDIGEDRFQTFKKDIFGFLKTADDRYDIVVLDPPKLAGTKKDLNNALNGYRNINSQAMKLLQEGGILLTFSCSGLVSPDLFHKIVVQAARESGRQFQLLSNLYADLDHPVNLMHPQGEYLKGLCLRVL